MPLFTSPVQPWIIDNLGIAPAASSHTLTANKGYLWAFELLAPCTITAMRWFMAATVTGTSDAGIYDGSGNLLSHTGAVTNVANVDNSANLLSSLALSPGRYYMALCPSNSTDTYMSISGLQDVATPSLTRVLFTVTNGSAGVLPSTTGGIALSNRIPVLAAVVSGGIA